VIAIRATGLSLLLVAHAASGAGSLRVAPTRLDLPQDRRAVALTITNTGSTATLMQLELKHWSQAAGADDYSPADDLVVSPPIFTLDAGAEQVVRVGRRNDRARSTGEVAWRLFVQEVPTPASATPQRELNVILRVGIPIFATPLDAPQASLEWHLQCRAGSPPMLLAVNRGGRALRLDELKVHAGEAEHKERAVYVLAGATRMVPLGVAASARRVEISGQSGNKRLEGAAACE
jgi:fimbrial chaperone protein